MTGFEGEIFVDNVFIFSVEEGEVIDSEMDL